MKSPMFRFMSIAVLVIAVLAGCSTFKGESTGQYVNDAAITTAVKAKLASDKAITLTRIDVDTTQGVVALNGVADSAAMKQRAEDLARQVNGVRSVVNNLQVQARAQ